MILNDCSLSNHFMMTEVSATVASLVAQWPKAVLAVPLEILGSSPGSVADGRDRETHRAAHNWASIVWVRGGFGRQECPCPIGH